MPFLEQPSKIAQIFKKFLKESGKMKQLQLGKIPSKELADWFGYSYSTYRKKKPELVKQLSKYCKYEEIYGGIIVKEIYVEEYVGDLELDIQEYLNQVRKYPLNSISNIAEEISKLPRYEKLSDRQRKRRMTAAGKLGFGETKERDSRGIYGTRKYQWSIKLDKPAANGKPYRDLTAEEQQIFNEYTTAVFGKNPEVIQNLKLLDDKFKHTDMTKEEYLNHEARLAFDGTFQDVIFKFREETGLIIVRATDHDLDEDENIPSAI